jgi:rubrerythrin
MGLFRVDEVLQIAMQAEETGRLLYEAVAAQATNNEVQALCRQLAAREKAHFETFKAMKDSQPSQTDSRRLSVEEIAFVQGLVSGKVVPNEAQARRLARENSLQGVLDMAIQAEKDSQTFYRQILPGVDGANAQAVQKIIDEEKTHQQRLEQVRSRLGD